MSDWKKIVILSVLGCILVFPYFFKMNLFESEMELNGVTITENFPKINSMNVMNGKYQNAVEEYFSQNIEGREIIIKCGNQIVYSLFNRSTHTGEILGKDGQIYEKEYIDKYLQYTPPVTDEYVEELIYKLGLLKDKLSKKSINLFVFITSSKAEIYSEDIPDVFYKCAPDLKESSYKKLTQALREANIPYFDAVPNVYELKMNEKERVYTKTGTHWSQLTGARIASQLIYKLEEAFGYDLTEIEVSQQVVDEPVHPDADIFNLLNILQKPYDTYYQPVVTKVSEGKDRPALVCQGGSFMGQSLTWLVNNDIVKDAVHIENTSVFENKYSELHAFTNYDELDIVRFMEDKDLLLLEVNQGAIEKMSFGFIDYLLEDFMLED